MATMDGGTALEIRQNLMRSLRAEFRKQEHRDSQNQQLAEKTIDTLHQLGIKITQLDTSKEPRSVRDSRKVYADRPVEKSILNTLNKTFLEIKNGNQRNFTQKIAEDKLTKHYRHGVVQWLQKMWKELRNLKNGTLGTGTGLLAAGEGGLLGMLKKGAKGFTRMLTKAGGLLVAGITAGVTAFGNSIKAVGNIIRRLHGTKAGKLAGAAIGAGVAYDGFRRAEENKGLSTNRNKEALLESVGGGALMGAEFGSMFGPEGTLIGGAIGALGGAGVTLFKEYHKTIMKWVDKFKKWGLDAIHTIENSVSNMWKKCMNWIHNLPNTFTKMAENFWNKIKNAGKSKNDSPPSREKHAQGLASRPNQAKSAAPLKTSNLPLPPPEDPRDKTVNLGNTKKSKEKGPPGVIMLPPIKKEYQPASYEIGGSRERSRNFIDTLNVGKLIISGFNRHPIGEYGSSGLDNFSNSQRSRLHYASWNPTNHQENQPVLSPFLFSGKVINADGFSETGGNPQHPYRSDITPKDYNTTPNFSPSPSKIPEKPSSDTPLKRSRYVKFIEDWVKNIHGGKTLSDYEVRKWGAESGNKFKATSPTGAVGPFQFLPSTWKDMVKKYGKKYGISNKDINNPLAQVIMTTLYDKETKNALIKAHLPVNKDSLYEGYVFGHYKGGVTKFQNLLKEHPNESAASYFPEQAKANPSLFYDKHDGKYDKPKSFAQVQSTINTRLESQLSGKEIIAKAKSEKPKSVDTETAQDSTNSGYNKKDQPERAGSSPKSDQVYQTSYVGSNHQIMPDINQIPLAITHNGLVLVNTGGLISS